MRALVTGATGFIGEHLVRALAAGGWQIRALARDPKKSRLLPAQTEVWFGDLTDPDSLEGIADDIDVVFHLAAALQGPWERHRLITVEGTRRLLEQSTRSSVRRFVYASSIAVYDKSHLDPDTLITEHAPLWRNFDIAGPYARGKIETERLVHETARATGMESVIVRPGLVYGRGHTIFQHLGIRIGQATFLPIGGSGVRLPLVHIDSVVDALLRLAHSPATDGLAFNIVDQEQASKAEYLRTLSRTNCRRYRCLGVPASPFTAAARATERIRAHPKAAWLPKVSADKIRARTVENRYDSSALREATGWRPAHDLLTGLRHALAARPGRRTPVRIQRAGLIGAGRVADFHVRALRSMGIEITGVLDIDRGAARTLARRFDIPFSTNDPDDFYRTARPQSVHILTPPHSHCALALDAVRRNVHVFLEKPATVTLDECDMLRQAARQQCITVGIDHNYIADSRIRRARRMIECSEIGDLVHIDIFWAFDLRRFRHMLTKPGCTEMWFTQLPGGPLEDLAPHPLSLALALLSEGAQPLSARAFRSGRLDAMFDDELRIQLSSRRATANISLSLSTSPDDLTATIYGTQSTLQLDLHNMLMIDSRIGPGPKALARGMRLLSRGTGTLYQTVRNSAALAFKRAEPPGSPTMLIRSHYEALAAGDPLPTDLEQGREILRIVRSVWPLLSPSPADDPGATSSTRIPRLTVDGHTRRSQV